MALYGILGDIHGNLEALACVLDALHARRVDQILCVGDIIGYNADPDDCTRLLRRHGVAAIAGNHDLIGTGRLGFDRCSNKAMHSLRRTRRRLEEETTRYLQSLPDVLPVEERVLLIHGGVRDVQQYMTQPRHIAENAQHLREDFPGRRICFFGHTHEPKVYEVDAHYEVRELPATGVVSLAGDSVYFVNSGSVDASRKRAHKFAEFALFDSAALTVEFRKTHYDASLTEAKAEAEGFRLHAWSDTLYTMRRRVLGVLGNHSSTR